MIPTLSPVTSGKGLSLPELVHLAARHKFRGIEFSLNETQAEVEKTSFAAVADLFESTRVLPVVCGLEVEWRRDEVTFRDGMQSLAARARLAQDLDCSRCITWVVPDSGEPVAEYSARSIRRLAEIGRVLQGEGVRLGLEFIGPKHFRIRPENVWFYDVPGALQAVDDITRAGQLENVGLLVDCWHWYTSGGSMLDLASIPVEMLVEVHVNDAPNKPVDDQIDNERLLPGESGVIDLPGFLQTLKALGYDGPLCVETFSAELDAMTADESAALASRALHGVMEQADIAPLPLL